MKTRISLLLWIQLAAWASAATVDIPHWFPKVPPVPPSQGEVIRVATADQLLAAVERAGPGHTILLADGQYKVPRVIVLQGKQDLTIRMWVRSRRVVVERNLILDCDRGVAFGNPGLSTADLEGERQVYVADGIIRNNFIAGGADCGIELWYAERIKVLNNSIWRPERNWSRGIRIGTGTMQTEIANNLVHGEILFDGGEAQLRNNRTGRLDRYFVDPASGNLALTPDASEAIDQGVTLPQVTEDIRGWRRVGRPDLGAWEFEPADR